MKKICVFAFESDRASLLCMREKKNELQERFELFRLKLQDVLYSNKKMAGVDIAAVAQLIKKLSVFTKPISVFTQTDVLYSTSCYDASTSFVYTLVGNQAFALLFRSDLNKLALNVQFEQIVTIKQVRELLVVNEKQLLAISNTQCVIFQRDPSECDDMQHLFQEGSTEIQCKRLIGKNIDIKVNF